MARAMAHGRTPVTKFEDPTAISLLPEDAREKVERARSGQSGSLFAGPEQAIAEARAGMMVARTVEIDDALRARKHDQVVILGAGLDGRAWRMKELADAIVFEVDHPDTQREKRARVGVLAQAAREVRFVPVDFTRDSLEEALERAGHDASRPTTWVWEGVVMYLTEEEVRSTLAVVAKRSAPGSRIVIAYLTRSNMLHRVVAIFVRSMGEPFRSAFTPDAMRALLAEHDFAAVRDENIPTIASGLSSELGHLTRHVDHLRIVTADKRT
jgi:methyltransferase (TIGR00027 family)